MRGEAWRAFVLTGDGELQEGSKLGGGDDASTTAGQPGGDRRSQPIQQGDFTEVTQRMSLGRALALVGFAVHELDGHDHAALLPALPELQVESGKPTCILPTHLRARAFPLRRINRPGIMVCPPASSLK